MTCSNCGNPSEPHARFCSRCGNELTQEAASAESVSAAPKEPVPVARDWEFHIKVLGWIVIGSAILTGLVGLMIVFAGQFFVHLPMMWPPDVPFDVVRLLPSLSVLAGLTVLALAAGIAAVGVGLLRYREWARIVAIILAALQVLQFPIGTAIALYAFWVLLSAGGSEHYRDRAQQLAA